MLVESSSACCQEDLQKEITEEKENDKSYKAAVPDLECSRIWFQELSYLADQALIAAKTAEKKVLEEQIVAKTQEGFFGDIMWICLNCAAE